MGRSILFVITLLAVCSLAAYVARRMFNVPERPQYEMSKMYFAAAVLAFLAYIFMLSIIVYALGPGPTPPSTDSPGKIIFDACVKIIPPLVTLIIGFYFGTSQQSNQPPPLEKKAVVPNTEQNKTVLELNEKVER